MDSGGQPQNDHGECSLVAIYSKREDCFTPAGFAMTFFIRQPAGCFFDTRKAPRFISREPWSKFKWLGGYQSVLHLMDFPAGTTTVTDTFVRGFAPSIEFLLVVTVLLCPLTVMVTCSLASQRMTPDHWFVE